jgi:hypothetical protein
MNDPAYSSDLASFEQGDWTFDMNALRRIAGTVLQGASTIKNGIDPREMRDPIGRVGRFGYIQVHDRCRD